jgi:ankyrin repeat protein
MNMKRNHFVAGVGLGLMVAFGVAVAEARADSLSSSWQQSAGIAGEEELFKAIAGGREQDVQGMLSADPRRAFAKDKNGVSALLTSVYRSKTSIVNLIRSYRKDDLSVFEAAAIGVDEKLGALLAESPALAMTFSPDGFTALHLASFFGPDASRAVPMLLAAGAQANAYSQNSFHASPLQSAVAASRLGAARLLLEHGANPNGKNDEGYTPLHEAAGSGQLDMIRLLLSFNADLSAKGYDGKTPYDVAVQYKQSASMGLLKKSSEGSDHLSEDR